MRRSGLFPAERTDRYSVGCELRPLPIFFSGWRNAPAVQNSTHHHEGWGTRRHSGIPLRATENRGQSRTMTLRSDECTFSFCLPSYSINPSFRNLFMK